MNPEPPSRSRADRGAQTAKADSISARWKAAGSHPVPADGKASERLADPVPADGEARGRPGCPGGAAARGDGRGVPAEAREREGGGEHAAELGVGQSRHERSSRVERKKKSSVTVLVLCRTRA